MSRPIEPVPPIYTRYHRTGKFEGMFERYMQGEDGTSTIYLDRASFERAIAADRLALLECEQLESPVDLLKVIEA